MEEGLEKKKQGIPNSMMGEIQNPKFQLVLNNWNSSWLNFAQKAKMTSTISSSLEEAHRKSTHNNKNWKISNSPAHFFFWKQHVIQLFSY